ncbi:MAG: ATP-binding protein [Planctomycetaceae bacterium]|jgi:hypothetical protein|nr:ATP-binding protein [Planctomycetaceae bacterium]
MSLLQTIQTGKAQAPPRLLIYGTEGIGKSTFGASAPKPIFIPTEDGLDHNPSSAKIISNSVTHFAELIRYS